MGRRKEYVLNMILTPEEAYNLAKTQEAFLNYAIDEANVSLLKNALGPVSTTLGVFALFVTSTNPAASVIASVASAMLAVTDALTGASEKQLIRDVAQKGYNSISSIEREMGTSGSQWQAVEVDMPMLEFVDEQIRIIQGKIDIKRVRIGNVWIDL